MAISRDIRRHIESGDFDALEDAWLAELADDPRDLGFFVGAARAVAGNGHEDRATMLLELLAEELEGNGDGETHLDLLRQAGHLMLEHESLHAEILRVLRQMHAGSSSLEGLIELVGLTRATHDIPKSWEKVDRLRVLLRTEVGEIVWMEGKGVGRVAEVNLELQSFKIDFDQHPALRVGFSAAGKLLQPLPPGHFQRRKLEDRESLLALKSEQPTELLRLALESFDRPLTAKEIREALAGLVEESEWSAWWGAARQHPQVLSSSAGRQAYRWAESGDDAIEQVRAAFESSNLRGKIAIFRKDADRDPALKAALADSLMKLADARREEKPEEAFVVWHALERGGALPEEPGWSLGDLLSGPAGPVAMITALEDRTLRERAIGLLRERHADAPSVMLALLEREEDPRVLGLLATSLEEEEAEEGGTGALDAFIDEVLSQPRKRPAAFVWLAERASTDTQVRKRNPLRLLQHLLTIGNHEEFKPYRARLKALWESSDCLAQLIARLTEDQAPRAYEALKQAAIEEYRRKPLLNALELRFPALRDTKSDAIYATKRSIAARRLELKKLLEVEIPANRKAIQEARELGDLRENFEYKSARERHEYLSARGVKMKRELEVVRAIDPAMIDGTEVRIGSRVELAGAGDSRRSMTILGPWESDPEDDVISYDSELAEEMLGKGPGSKVQISGEAFEIAAIRPFES